MKKTNKHIDEVNDKTLDKNDGIDEIQAENIEVTDEVTDNKKNKASEQEPERIGGEIDKAQEYFSQMQRIQAEFENYRKRVVKERAELIKSANEKLLMQMLPLIDNFQRALESLEEHVRPEDKTFCEGVEIIYRQFVQLIEKNGVKPIETVGKPFDPNFHNAIQQVPNSDVPEHYIVEEVSKGYTLNGKLLRAAMVVVAKPEEKENEKEKENENID